MSADRDTVEVDREALNTVLDWALHDPALELADPDDPITAALLEIHDAARDEHLCERCTLPQTAHYRLADGTCLCQVHADNLAGDTDADDIQPIEDGEGVPA
jgi:hypothetical protein